MVVLPVSLSCCPSKSGLLKSIQVQGVNDGLAKQSTLAADVIWQLMCDMHQNCFSHLCSAVLQPEWGDPSPGLQLSPVPTQLREVFSTPRPQEHQLLCVAQ